MSQSIFFHDDRSFRWREILTLIFLALFLLLLRVPTLVEPWGADQGVYGYIADGILKGKVPYRDMYTSTGYGLFFLYALIFKLFGNNMMALHIGDFISILATVILIYYVARLLYGKECAVISGALAAIFGSGSAFSYLYEMKGAWGKYWQLAQRETFMTTFILAGILLMILADRHKKWYIYFFAGLFIGLSAVLKITTMALLTILVLYIFISAFFSKEGGGIKLFFLKSAALILGIVIIQVPFLYYFWMQNSLNEMYQAVFVHTSIYAKLSRGLMIVNAFEGNTYVIIENLALWIFSLGAIVYFVINERKRENLLVIAWTLGTLMMIWGQGKFFGYHFLIVIGPLSVLAGYGIKRFLKIAVTWKDSVIASFRNIIIISLWVLLVSNVVVFLGGNYNYYRWSGLYLLGKISTEKYYEVFNEFPLHLYSFRSDNQVANYLKDHAQPGDSLRTINCGGDTVIHYLSGLKSATRFTSTWYLFNKDLYSEPLTERLRQEFIQDIRIEKPEYILLIYFTLEEFRKDFNGDDFKDLLFLLQYIGDNYKLEKTFEDRRTLYKRI